MCRILEIFTGSDGVARSAKIEVMNTDKGKTVSLRPFKLLIPLEVRNVQDSIATKSGATQSSPALGAAPKVINNASASAAAHSAPAAAPALSVSATSRPKRNSAVIADLRMKES